MRSILLQKDYVDLMKSFHFLSPNVLSKYSVQWAALIYTVRNESTPFERSESFPRPGMSKLQPYLLC